MPVPHNRPMPFSELWAENTQSRVHQSNSNGPMLPDESQSVRPIGNLFLCTCAGKGFNCRGTRGKTPWKMRLIQGEGECFLRHWPRAENNAQSRPCLFQKEMVNQSPMDAKTMCHRKLDSINSNNWPHWVHQRHHVVTVRLPRPPDTVINRQMKNFSECGPRCCFKRGPIFFFLSRCCSRTASLSAPLANRTGLPKIQFNQYLDFHFYRFEVRTSKNVWT